MRNKRSLETRLMNLPTVLRVDVRIHLTASVCGKGVKGVSREALIECFAREVEESNGDTKCLVGPICMCALMVRGPVCRALKWNEILSLLCLSSGLWLNRSSDKGTSEAITHRRRFHTWQLDSGRPIWLVITPVSRNTPTFPLRSSNSNILTLHYSVNTLLVFGSSVRC